MFVERVGIVGAGTMGADIAAAVALRGIPVRICDVDPGQLTRAASRIQSLLEQRVRRGRLTAAAAADRVALVAPSTDWAALTDVDLVVEAVPERLELKCQVLSQLDHQLPPLAILASNTSAQSVSVLAEATGRAERVIGCHFFFPAFTMPLVEVVRTPETRPDVLAAAVGLWEECRKLPLVVEDQPGFVVNRVLMRALAEVFRFEEETGAAPASIDAALASSGLVPLGPFQLCDALGLDVVSDVAGTLARELGKRFEPSARLADLVSAGRLGAKVPAGGFYVAGEEATAPELSDAARSRLIRRFQLAAANEAARVLDEQPLSARQIDLALAAGAGLKRGPLAWADQEGLDAVQHDMEEASALGLRGFEMPTSLDRLVRQGWTGVRAGRGFLGAAAAGGPSR